MTWSPSPSYLLRRWTVLRELRHEPRASVLEIGSGAGDLMAHLVARGHRGTCVEISPQARAEARERFTWLGQPVEVLAELPSGTTYDLLLACEVLEHIEDDLGELKRWRALVGENGKLLITVPAHPRRFGPSDVWAGHFRRYTRVELLAKLRGAGFAVTRCICFGFPAGNLIEPIRHRSHARHLVREGVLPQSERSQRSGVERGLERRLRWLWRPALIAPWCWLQLPFTHTDWGTSLLAIGEPRRERAR